MFRGRRPAVKLSFDAVRVSGSQAYVSGHGPLDGTSVLMEGKVGAAVSVEQGLRGCSAHGAVDAGHARARAGRPRSRGELGEGARVRELRAGLQRHPAVVNGFSDLIGEVWGDAGRHARSAVGVAELPFDMRWRSRRSSKCADPGARLDQLSNRVWPDGPCRARPNPYTSYLCIRCQPAVKGLSPGRRAFPRAT